VADKSTQLILNALNRAILDPDGLPLYDSKHAPGLFPPTTLARQAAQRCKDEGLVRVLTTETRGKQVQEMCVLTEKGLAYLLREANPREVLEDFVRALEARQAQLQELVRSVQRTGTGLESLKAAAEQVLQQLLHQETSPATAEPSVNGNGALAWPQAALRRLAQWQGSGALKDHPLPDLYRYLQASYPTLTTGQFHDGLRQLHQEEKIYPHPWTGPLCDLPEPTFALLIGHVIVYYVSLK
jgi:hypothetical protein